MKKLLLLFGILMMASPAWAGTLTLTTYLSGNDVTIANLESDNNAIETFAAGNIESENIKDGTIESQDMAESVSIVTRYDETFNDFTVSGMLPATSANLTSDISAGVSYVDGIRVSTSATSHTYTASKDTYVYIHSGGYFVYEEVANGAAAPSTPSNSLLLAKAVTNGAAIASVTDSRTLSVQITTTTSNFPADYRNGCLVKVDSTTTTHMEPGTLAIGTTLYSNLADTAALSTATSGNWLEGSSPNLANQPFFVYAYNASGSTLGIKYCSADPVYSDTDENTGGVLRYYKSGSDYYRALAWLSGDASGNIYSYNSGQVASNGVVNVVSRTPGAYASLGSVAIPNDDSIPQITEGNNAISLPFRATSINNKLRFDVTFFGSAVAAPLTVALFKDGTAGALAVATGDTGAGNEIETVQFTFATAPANTSIGTYRIRAGSSGSNACYMNGVAGASKYGGVGASSLTITEVEG
jgi:hypothetical protein